MSDTNVIETSVGNFTPEQLVELLKSDAAKKILKETKESNKQKILERQNKAREMQEHVDTLCSLANIKIPAGITIKKIGVSDKSDTYKEVYVNFRFKDDVPHCLSCTVNGDNKTSADVIKLTSDVASAKIKLLRLVSKME
jgi:ABC-type molybdate transport system substrate-binding protein